jgi:transcription-repair coupling factor (superfamily II helicase)
MSTQSKITISGAPEGFDAQLILQELGKSNTPVCHIARDDKRLVAMQDALRFFAPDLPVIVFPGWDCLPYDRVSMKKGCVTSWSVWGLCKARR